MALNQQRLKGYEASISSREVINIPANIF